MHYKFNILNFKSFFLMNYSIISEYSSNSLLANKKSPFVKAFVEYVLA